MYHLNHINKWWDKEYIDLEYIPTKFNNNDDIERWEELGFLLRENVGSRYIASNIDSEQVWIKKFYSVFYGKDMGITIFKMCTGDIIPYHSDSYNFYRHAHNIADPTKICRTVIFLEDWKPGHIFEIESTPITQWIAGDCITWDYRTPHMAANLGPQTRYTAQITYHV